MPRPFAVFAKGAGFDFLFLTSSVQRLIFTLTALAKTHREGSPHPSNGKRIWELRGAKPGEGSQLWLT